MTQQTHRETILRAIKAVMVAADLKVFRSRAEAFARKELPAVVVKPGGEQSTRLGKGSMSRTFQILIEVHAVADSSASPKVTADQAGDAVILRIHAAVFAPGVLEDVVGDIVDKEMQEPSFADADEERVVITLVYEAIYSTAERSIATIN